MFKLTTCYIFNSRKVIKKLEVENLWVGWSGTTRECHVTKALRSRDLPGEVAKQINNQITKKTSK